MKINLKFKQALRAIKPAVGYIAYRSTQTFLSDSVTLNGRSLGTFVSTGIEYLFTQNAGLFINAGATSGALRRFYVTDGDSASTIDLEDGQAEGLGNINVSLGFRLHF